MHRHSRLPGDPQLFLTDWRVRGDVDKGDLKGIFSGILIQMTSALSPSGDQYFNHGLCNCVLDPLAYILIHSHVTIIKVEGRLLPQLQAPAHHDDLVAPAGNGSEGCGRGQCGPGGGVLGHLGDLKAARKTSRKVWNIVCG